MATTTEDHRGSAGAGDVSGDQEHGGDMERKMYLRFAAMIVTGMFVMYWVMFVGSYSWSHIQFSQSRVYMALVMGGAMTLVMLGWMLNMYKNVRVNVGIVVVGLLLIGFGTFLDRSQATVGDVEFMQGMIPHHSLAITRAERFNVEDGRVCELAVAISEAQRREIDEMEWLIEDIRENGPASTRAEIEARPVPEFPADAVNECNPD
jgi:hypothetical protein